MKLYHKALLPVFYALVLLTLIYSYFFIDPNITLLNNSWWAALREGFIYVGYYRREFSSIVFILLIGALFTIHSLLVRQYKKLNLKTLLVPLVILGIFSYPFVSHDFFNYLFDAKILTFYHANPYIHKALDFPHDDWLRFMHWTHRTYPYGPVFLLLTLIPSIASFGKLLLNVIFFKSFFLLFYLVAVYRLAQLNKKWAVEFATHPLVIIEGLVASHNDIVGVSLALIGIYYLFKKKKPLFYLFTIFSVGIKYITLPAIFLRRRSQDLNYLGLFMMLFIIGYISVTGEIQPWYFLNLLIFIPFFPTMTSRLKTLFAGLLLSYYPYIRYGDWSKIQIKYEILEASVIINLLILAIFYLKDRRNSFSANGT